VYRTDERLRHGDARGRDSVFGPVRFSVGVVVAAVVFLVAAAAWMGTCGGSTFDTVACGAPQATLLALGAPLILVAGAVRAFVRAHQASRQEGGWWPWQGAGWFLMAVMLVVLVEGVPSIAVP
jgi:hypothetical protein